jgi:ribosomal protein S18 acetylase RimI-like enzyme
LRQDPVPNVFLLHLAYKTGLRTGRTGVAFLGHFEKERLLGAGAFGGSLLAWGTGQETLSLLKDEALRRQNRWQSLLGDNRVIGPLWNLLAPYMDPPSEDRTELWLSLPPERFRPSPTSIKVRPAREYDLQNVFQLRLGLHEEPGGRRLSMEDRNRLRKRCRDSIRDGVMFVAEAEGDLVFMAVFSATTPEVTQISSVFTHRDYRGRGIATHALSFLCRYALQRSERVSLFVSENNAPARHIYEKLGFERSALARSIRLSSEM